jgi:hypothetical protein
VHRPSQAGGRRVTLFRHGQDEILGLAHSDHDLIVFLEAAGVIDPDRVLDDPRWVEWGGGRSSPASSGTVSAIGISVLSVVDGTMRSVSHLDVYAVGDAAMAMGPGDKPLRMSCASGVPAAWQAADAVAARLTGGKVPKMPIRYVNQCISPGRKESLIQYVIADDRAVDAALTGRLAAVHKSLVCRRATWGVAHLTFGLPARRRVVWEAVATTGSPAEVPA